jgi:hypothetical protein
MDQKARDYQCPNVYYSQVSEYDFVPWFAHSFKRIIASGFCRYHTNDWSGIVGHVLIDGIYAQVCVEAGK